MMKKKASNITAMETNFAPIKQAEGFTILELMVVLTLIGILAATAMPLFTNYAARSKTSEALVGLAKMSQGEVEYFTKNGNFIEAGPTNIPPPPNRQSVDFSTDPRWESLSFGFSDPILFGYQAVAPSATQIDCEALGDLNGNGVTSTFRRSVTSTSGSATLGGIQIFDELE